MRGPPRQAGLATCVGTRYEFKRQDCGIPVIVKGIRCILLPTSQTGRQASLADEEKLSVLACRLPYCHIRTYGEDKRTVVPRGEFSKFRYVEQSRVVFSVLDQVYLRVNHPIRNGAATTTGTCRGGFPWRQPQQYGSTAVKLRLVDNGRGACRSQACTVRGPSSSSAHLDFPAPP